MIRTDKIQHVSLKKDEDVGYAYPKLLKTANETFSDIFDKVGYVLDNATDEQLKMLGMKYPEVKGC